MSKVDVRYNHEDVVFFSDPHISHGNIIKYCHRPYLAEADKRALERDGVWHRGDWKGEGSSRWRITEEAIEMMNTELIKNINSVTTPNSEVWCLGDVAFGPKNDDSDSSGYFKLCKNFVDQINCKSFNVIWGNHDDRCFDYWECEKLPKQEHDRRCIGSLFDRSYTQVHISVKGQLIVLNHYAMAVWDKSHRGAWQLYGHSHSQAEPWMNKNMPGRRSFDVGVDNAKKLLGAYRPFRFSEIVKLMANQEGFSMDHHIPKNSKAPEESELV